MSTKRTKYAPKVFIGRRELLTSDSSDSLDIFSAEEFSLSSLIPVDTGIVEHCGSSWDENLYYNVYEKTVSDYCVDISLKDDKLNSIDNYLLVDYEYNTDTKETNIKVAAQTDEDGNLTDISKVYEFVCVKTKY